MSAAAAEDTALVQRAVQGDRSAFAALVRRHQRGLFGFLGRMGLSQGEAEDLAQDSLLRAWRHLDQFDPHRAVFSTWLYTIARRLALNWLDRSEHALRAPAAAASSTADHGVDADPTHHAAAQPVAQGGWGDDPARQLELQRERAQLQAGLRRLPLADRSLLALAYVHELSLAQIAGIEGVSEAAAKVRLHRARGRLRALLAPQQAPAAAAVPVSAPASAPASTTPTPTPTRALP